jgi:hypothetical protein
LLAQASELRNSGKADQARNLVAKQAVPLWIQLAPEIRRAMLDFQSVVSTRSDLGTLASLQNKLVRLGLVRLRLSLQEFIGELPPETETLYADLIKPDPNAPVRLFVPTRPSLLARGERVRIMIVATGLNPVHAVQVHTRIAGASQWTAAPAKLLGRRTYEAVLGPFDPNAVLVDYFASASVGPSRFVAPPAGDKKPHTITLV